MKRIRIELACIAWPPYRARLDAHRGWCMVYRASRYLLNHPDWDRGDYEAGKIFVRTLNELNR